ncbi:MAG: Fis family transcriptional regulator [Symploca sp. SIO1B1]|nr:Fis family transcriptional regulator [Symploca sp. SIO2D2]NER24846.1 Fis family transcriptional regulator [Symploca sp. SIO1C2]NER45241.1 Fis family transcriptional regulator [Symploca sp. SIO1A3]NER92446.1 Fis family transcriptional regulator [Symploca sp. SIO1B1]
MDSLQRDRFELLSAYIDGEVTAAERHQVQDLLSKDPDMQRLHARLMKLRQGLQQLSVPVSETTAPETAQQVFSKIDRRRSRKVFIWGGAALAALFVGAVSGVFSGNRSFLPQLASSPEPEVVSEPLMISANQPVIKIPKAAVSSPDKLVDPSIINRELNQDELN